MTRILIAPDDLLDIEQTSILRRRDFTLLHAPNGPDAIVAAGVTKPALIMFGNPLPGMDPQEFVETVRDSPPLFGTKLLMVTDSADASEERPHGIHGHLVAPLDPVFLSKTVGTVLGIRTRHADRVDVEVLAQVEHLGELHPHRRTALVTLVNLSETGVRVESEAHLRLNATGGINFYLPGETMKFTLQCVVRTLIDEMQLHYGLEFLDLSPADQRRLKKFVESRMARTSE